MKSTICKLLDISDVSYYRWKKDRKIIPFLEKYFSKEELEEYIIKDKIEKLEIINKFSTEELKSKLYSKDFAKNNSLIINFVEYNIKNILGQKNIDFERSVKLFDKIKDKIDEEITTKNCRKLVLDTLESFDVKFWDIFNKTGEHPLQLKHSRVNVEKMSDIEIFVLLNSNRQ